MTLPSDLTFIRGTKDSADVISQEKPLEIGDQITLLHPNNNQFLAWAMKNGKTVSSPQTTFGHLEDTSLPNWTQYTGATEAAQDDATTYYFEAGFSEKVQQYTRLFNPRSGDVVLILQAVAADNITAATGWERNWGRGTTASLWQSGDRLLILPPNYPEGFSTGDALSSTKNFVSFYMSEVSWPVDVTFVENAEIHRGGNAFDWALKKAWKQSKDQMEGELLFSGKKSDTTFSNSPDIHPNRGAEGIDNFITTNVFSANSISRMDLWDIIQVWRQFYKDPGGAIVCGTQFKGMVTEWAHEVMTITVGLAETPAGVIGLEIDRVKTPWGAFDLLPVDLLSQEENLAGTVFFVPTGGRIKFRPLVGYENLNIGYRPINQDEVHSKKGEIYGVYGWEYHDEPMWAKLSGLDLA